MLLTVLLVVLLLVGVVFAVVGVRERREHRLILWRALPDTPEHGGTVVAATGAVTATGSLLTLAGLSDLGGLTLLVGMLVVAVWSVVHQLRAWRRRRGRS